MSAAGRNIRERIAGANMALQVTPVYALALPYSLPERHASRCRYVSCLKVQRSRLVRRQRTTMFGETNGNASNVINPCRHVVEQPSTEAICLVTGRT
ncbi:hypothetical protein NPIL_331681 [Nephila pilipes]|uniref:Uncharacterized protein n=1 Tax=Nephila pilipes TaxID=299642 RepID=A0A8X6PA61_NEPPI|nr:hypothetical protein NPIL_331681 [Nephila pilipes]